MISKPVSIDARVEKIYPSLFSLIFTFALVLIWWFDDIDIRSFFVEQPTSTLLGLVGLSAVLIFSLATLLFFLRKLVLAPEKRTIRNIKAAGTDSYKRLIDYLYEPFLYFLFFVGYDLLILFVDFDAPQDWLTWFVFQWIYYYCLTALSLYRALNLCLKILHGK